MTIFNSTSPHCRIDGAPRWAVLLAIIPTLLPISAFAAEQATQASAAFEPAAVEPSPDVVAPPPVTEPVAEPTPVDVEPEPVDEVPPPPVEEPPPLIVEPVPTVEPPPPPKHAIDPKINFGLGLRTWYNADIPSGDEGDKGFAQGMAFNVRPYINGQINDFIKFEANLDADFIFTSTDGIGVNSPDTLYIRPLDAVMKFEPHPAVNFWIGRFLPPTDRANLSGPFYQNAWNFPVEANNYPSIYAGRHNGVAYWGKVKDGKFKWQLGMFDVTGQKLGAEGNADTPLFVGKVIVNILDPEPIYYNGSTQYGASDTLAIGAVIEYQKGGNLGAIGNGLDASGLDGIAFNVEALFEKALGKKKGVLTIEAAYYNFEDTSLGSSFNGQLSYLFPSKRIGRVQPMVRLQYFMPDSIVAEALADPWATVDAALHYIVNGHKTRFALNYQFREAHDSGFAASPNNNHVITLGGQFQL